MDTQKKETTSIWMWDFPDLENNILNNMSKANKYNIYS